MGASVGIDLGATKCVVAAARASGDPVRILRNEFGETETQSVVAEDDQGHIVVGRKAARLAARHDGRAIVLAKRWLGQEKTFALPNHGQVLPEDAIAFLLQHLKESAERELGEEVDNAVIGIPWMWTATTQHKLREAAARAGFRTVQLLPEPIAAAMACYTGDKREPLHILTYDLGGGKFEAAVVEIRDGQFRVLCGTGDGYIGGCLFDGLLADWFWIELMRYGYILHHGHDRPPLDRVYTQLLQEAERSKLRLSAEARTDISVPYLGEDLADDPIALEMQIERHQFDHLIAPFVDQTLGLCRQMLEVAGIALDGLDHVMLLGGSSRIPLVRQRCGEAFRREPRQTHSLHCVAHGAAMLASRELQSSQSKICDAPYSPYVATLSLPIQIEFDQGLREIIPAGVRLPFETTLQLQLSGHDRQLRVPLFQAGESIGLLASPIPENLRPQTALEIALHVDDNSQVSATVRCPDVGWEYHVPVKPFADDDGPGEQHDAARRSNQTARRSEMLDPPHEQFQRLVAEARELLSHIADRFPWPEMNSPENALSALQDEAERAWTNHDGCRWQECFERLVDLRSGLQSQVMQSWDEFEFLTRIVPTLLHEVLRLNADTPASIECVADVQRLLEDVEKVDFIIRRLTRSDPFVHETLHRAEACVRRFQSLKQRLDSELSQSDATRLTDMHKNVREWCQDGLGGRRVTDDSDWTLRGGSWQTLRSGSPQVPAANIDCVHFSVTSPTSVQPGTAFILDVWAHLEQQRKQVLERAQQQQGGRDILMQSKGPVSVARGTVLTVRLKIDGLLVPDPEDTILWQGEIGNARFQINVPQDAATGERAGVAGIYADGLRIAKLYFSIPVTEHAGATATLPLKHDRHQRAFASYASEDRDQVLGRLQGMQKRTPSLEIFLDVLALRSGQNWEQELYHEISRSDVFYLFWSEFARESEWVDREWHCALERRGLDFIDPVPLVDPKIVPPPPELASKHFNDWVLAFLSPLNGVPPVS